MAAFPTTLPNPISDGYGISPVDPVIRTDMEVGAGRSRRRTLARNDKVSVSWFFTDAQLSAFRTWFEDPTAGADGGAKWFTITLALGTGGSVSTTARFTKVFNVRHSGGLQWTVSAELEIQ